MELRQTCSFEEIIEPEKEVTDQELMRIHNIDSDKLCELKDIFNSFDSDGNGSISTDELSKILNAVSSGASDAQIKLIMNKADIDGDGTIGLNEFILLFSEFNDFNKLDDSTEACFKVFDKDDDGFITVNELKTVLLKIGHDFSVTPYIIIATDKQLAEMFSEADVDGDGKVTYQEFQKMLNSK